MPDKRVTVTFMENFVLSGAAAVISKTAAAPMERIKLLIQNQDEMLRLNRLKEPYRGIKDCALRTIRSEGFLAFWKSNFVNCIRYFPTQALNFAFKDHFKALIKSSSKETYSKKFAKNIFAGGAAGSLTSCFVYSLDYARTRLANDAKLVHGGDNKLQGRQFDGIVDVYKKTWASDGLRGLYRGFVISVIATAVYRGFYFGLYDSLKPLVLAENAGVMETFVLSYTITVTANLIAYPMDTVRRRMMMRSGEEVKYKGSMDCFKQIIQNEGLKSAWKGSGANVLRNVAGAGVLVGFDELQKYHRRWKRRSIA